MRSDRTSSELRRRARAFERAITVEELRLELERDGQEAVVLQRPLVARRERGDAPSWRGAAARAAGSAPTAIGQTGRPGPARA